MRLYCACSEVDRVDAWVGSTCGGSATCCN